MDATPINLEGEWELSFDKTLDGIVVPLPNPYHRLKFGPAKAITAFAFVSPQDKEYAGEYLPPDPPTVPENQGTLVAYVFFAASKPSPHTVISIIQNRPDPFGTHGYYAAFSARPEIIPGSGPPSKEKVDMNTITGAWFDNENNRGDFKLVRVLS